MPNLPKHRVTASTLNVRRGPSIQDDIAGTLHAGDIVDVTAISTDQKWLRVDKPAQGSDLVGWAASKFLVEAAPVAAGSPVDGLLQIAATSAIATYNWLHRGIASRGYTKGMAIAFGRAYCKLKNGDAAAVEMAKAVTNDPAKDALAYYANQFESLGMSNEASGELTLRHLFVLLLGLGMRESSGHYCEGRDRSANNTSADTAEAGLFQVSFNATDNQPMLQELVTYYKSLPSVKQTVFKSIFEEAGPPCTASELQNFGTGPGRDFQELTKNSPVFAAEFAALGLRHIRKHWGPINTRKAELRSEADHMFLKIQLAIDADYANLSTALTA